VWARMSGRSRLSADPVKTWASRFGGIFRSFLKESLSKVLAGWAAVSLPEPFADKSVRAKSGQRFPVLGRARAPVPPCGRGRITGV
jgi:hypothetical protein